MIIPAGSSLEIFGKTLATVEDIRAGYTRLGDVVLTLDGAPFPVDHESASTIATLFRLAGKVVKEPFDVS